jgi:hypothetical protein
MAGLAGCMQVEKLPPDGPVQTVAAGGLIGEIEWESFLPVPETARKTDCPVG